MNLYDKITQKEFDDGLAHLGFNAIYQPLDRTVLIRNAEGNPVASIIHGMISTHSNDYRDLDVTRRRVLLTLLGRYTFTPEVSVVDVDTTLYTVKAKWITDDDSAYLNLYCSDSELFYGDITHDNVVQTQFTKSELDELRYTHNVPLDHHEINPVVK